MTDLEARLCVAVIIGSTREGRVADKVGGWFIDRAKRREEIELTVIDLADFDFPPRYPVAPTPAMTEFTGRIALADAFVVVTPEYNRSFPASLKQAIDYGYDEWRAKPVGFVSYGIRSEGIHAVEQLRVVFTELHAVTMRDQVGVNLLSGCLDDAGFEQAGGAMLDQLIWWGQALRDARRARPYCS